MKLPRCIVVLPLLLALPTLALAHPGHEVLGFASGVLHPLTGLDHLLAMIAVGLWAAQLGGRARIAVPLSFVLLMLLGAVLGRYGFTASSVIAGSVEQGIAASVLVLGLLLAFAVSLPLLPAMLLTAGFALFHGYAHGEEAPLQANVINYMIGFALTTAALHGAGLLLGSWLVRQQQPAWLRWTGAAVALSGLALFAA